ncbi:AraC family transcriptional regulator [Thalassospira indica]|uniref:AraC family transcriptional regulator n=1 Tax=Thalassospira indica TaxID=1891279 RepID=A0ABM6Y7I4_9PROT|nr:AraC family transcriptional regulator [Thalassospira indica]
MGSPFFIRISPVLSDPLVEIIHLLQPNAVFSKGISGAGEWAVRYSPFGYPSFCVVMDGSCRLAVDGHDSIRLEVGDFILLPETPAFTMSGFETTTPEMIDPEVAATRSDEVRHGRQSGPPDVRLLGGYFIFSSPDAGLLTSLLPGLIHLRGVDRLVRLVGLIVEETGEWKPGRELVLSRLVEILLIEALRSAPDKNAPPGLLKGLADERIVAALRQIHGNFGYSWSVASLAKEAALSRSAFFERFARTVGMAPMQYLLSWRMAVAKGELAKRDCRIADVAERVGYGSASAFSIAFSRHVGVPPGQYARECWGEHDSMTA